MMGKVLDGIDKKSINDIADALSQYGRIILPQALNNELLHNLQQRAQSIVYTHWLQAGVGCHKNYQFNTEIRSDKIYWLTPDNPIEASFLSLMENIRYGLNQRLFMGLFDYESHFSVYAKGAYYQKHMDALKGEKNRVISTVLYLNANWQASDGGELLLYSDSGDIPIERILPQLGTLVIFLSDQFPHEVIKANRRRFSLSGWFRVNSSGSQRVNLVS